jgi:hypothetical protein
MKSYKFLITGLATASLLVASVASAQAVPALGVGVNASVLPVATGAQNTVVAFIALTASGAPVTVASLPVTASGNVGALTNCQLRNVNNFSAPLTTNNNVVSTIGTTNTFTFDTPITVAAGVTMNLYLTCNTAPGTTGSVTLGITPSTIPATSGAITVTGGTATVNGTALPTNGTITFGPATVGDVNPGTGTTVPTVPNTGAGGALDTNLAILALSGLVALAGALTLRRMRTR